ncbi:MAG: sugar-binding protein [Chloroflexota bacterium]
MFNSIRRKFFYYLLLFLPFCVTVLLVISLSASSRSGQNRVAIIAEATAAPIIDGTMEGIWAEAQSYSISTIVTGSTSITNNDFAASFQGMYDSENLYLLVEVIDETLITDSEQFWHDDLVEIYLDGDRSRGQTYDEVDDFHYLFRWDDPIKHIADGSISVSDQIQVQMLATSAGYILEFSVPLSVVGIDASTGYEFGLDVHVIDDDDGGPRDHKLTWNAIIDQAWEHPILFGTGKLAAATDVPTETVTTTPINTPTPSPFPLLDVGDNDTCDNAQQILANGQAYSMGFQSEADVDWLFFEATAGETYRVEGMVPPDSLADLSVELYTSCSGPALDIQAPAFSTDVKIDFASTQDGPVYLRFINGDTTLSGERVTYAVTTRGLSQNHQLGALILVAGRNMLSDPLQSNIRNATDTIYFRFQSLGYPDDRIFYLSTDNVAPGFDGEVTANQLQTAIQSWARDKVGDNRMLTLYMVGHGAPNSFYLDRSANETLSPAQLDAWLSDLETTVPGVQVNVIIDAPNAGSFITASPGVSKSGRVIVTSTDAQSVAFASPDRTLFSDYFVNALYQGQHLHGAFWQAQQGTQYVYPSQIPQIDRNGNGVPNESADFAPATLRNLDYTGVSTADLWAPRLFNATSSEQITNGEGLIQVEVQDDTQVKNVYAVVYSPTYAAPLSGTVFTGDTLPVIVLQAQGNNLYSVLYSGFTEIGAYRVVIYATDNHGIYAQPAAALINDVDSTPTFTPTLTFTITPTPSPTDTPTTRPTNTPTHTPTDTPTFTPAPHTPTVTPVPPTDDSGTVDANNDTCSDAELIATDGTGQDHIFQVQADVDWVTFNATANTTYHIEVSTDLDSLADVTMELYRGCSTIPDPPVDPSFNPGIRHDMQTDRDGPIYLKLANFDANLFGPNARYKVSVRPVAEGDDNKALIIVAGRLRGTDQLQSNINGVTERVYRLFQQNGYTDETIYYMGTTTQLPGYDGAATKELLRLAVTEWAAEKLSENGVLTLYMIDHGSPELFYIDELNGQRVSPAELNEWLDELESTVPGIKMNIIIEACQSGSFIDKAGGSISKRGRVVISSTNAENDAKASRDGAYFSDHFLTSLQLGDTLASSFSKAQKVAESVFALQKSWLDANGNGEPNEFDDAILAAERSFEDTGTLISIPWAPYIFSVAKAEPIANFSGTIQADVRDDTKVSQVWAVVYSPDYVTPENSQELQAEILPHFNLTSTGEDNLFAGIYTGFIQPGTYRIVVHAIDNGGLVATPREIEVVVEEQVSPQRQLFLPMVIR